MNRSEGDQPPSKQSPSPVLIEVLRRIALYERSGIRRDLMAELDSGRSFGENEPWPAVTLSFRGQTRDAPRLKGRLVGERYKNYVIFSRGHFWAVLKTHWDLAINGHGDIQR
jgi:hypothetical protein